MCGRFSLDAKPKVIQDYFAISNEIITTSNYNIAPSQTVLTIMSDKHHHCITQDMVWGMTSLRQKKQIYVINIRSESILHKFLYQKMLHEHRCLIIASSFFE